MSVTMSHGQAEHLINLEATGNGKCLNRCIGEICEL